MTDVVYGVDVSTKAIAFASLPEGRTRTLSVAAKPGIRRLAVAYPAIYGFVRALATSDPPVAVWIEQPTGRHPKPSLGNMAGVAAAAIYNALHDHYGLECPVFFIAVSEWKKAATGKGNATKDEVSVWASNVFGKKARTEDESDALAIGYAGQSMMLPLAA